MMATESMAHYQRIRDRRAECPCNLAQAMLSTALRLLYLREAQMSKRIQVNVGDRYGRLVIVSEAEQHGYYRRFECQCDCGAVAFVKLQNLRSGNSQSCGCQNTTCTIKHGLYGTGTYRSWGSMKHRCLNPHSVGYKNYGGRGISVCQRWQDSFEAFLEDMGERPAGHTIDRIDNDGDYQKSNCRWATPQEQNRNQRTNHLLTLDGVTLCLTDWAKRVGLPRVTLYIRLKKGWAVEDALTIPVNGKRKDKTHGATSCRNHS